MNLETLKVELREMQGTLQKRVEKIAADFRAGRSADFAEQATETENDEVLQNIKAEAELELRQVNAALNRIEQGRYGECETCGDAIAIDRLRALPYSTECINCAAKH